jgi:fumarylpyruvate hydrolase
MTDWIFPPSPQAAVPVIGRSERFPVHRIYCVGRNYAAHRREMGGDDRDPPFFFAKPADAVVLPGQDVAYPTMTAELHHEIELVVAIGGEGSSLSVAEAADLVLGYAVGVDLTRRDLQTRFKDKGQPWDAAKGFDHSAPISPILLHNGLLDSRSIQLSVNGATRQSAVTADMIWSIAEIIAQASSLWHLRAGDLIFTGTPEGVGPLVSGDKVQGSVDGVGQLDFAVI